MQCHIHYNLILGHAKEYSQIAHALAPLSLTHTSSNIISTLMVFHLDLGGFLFLFENLQTRPRF
jgi:NADH:ubiquinone oxidoreductase subunit H